MKLFVKYNRVNIFASIFAFLLGSIGYYFIIRYVLIHQLDDTLKVEEAEILSFVQAKDQLPEPANYRDQKIRFTSADLPVKRKFINTTLFDPRHREDRYFRQLLFSVTVSGQAYTVSVSKSEDEARDLLGWVVLITIGVILLLMGILFLANRILLRRLWQPFYNTLGAIRTFNLSNRRSLPAHPATPIDEFKELDAAVGQMTQKILKDYEMLKNFADNASHEMQTPLAIINSKLDLMIQDPALEEKHLRQLQAMYDAVRRLSKMNQSLLLLTKIENNQFADTDLVDLAPLIEEKLLQFEDLIRAKNLSVRSELDHSGVRMNPYLADILLNNLLSNAIRHNQADGRFTIDLHDDHLDIGNTGPVFHFDPALIFDRFTKGPRSEGTGLGLAIVRQICDNYGFALSYSFREPLHIIHIRLASFYQMP